MNITKSKLKFIDNIYSPNELLNIYNTYYLTQIGIQNIQTYQCFRNASIFLISRLYNSIKDILKKLQPLSIVNPSEDDKNKYIIIQTLVELKCDDIINNLFSGTDNISKKRAKFLDDRFNQTSYPCYVKHQQFGLLDNPEYKKILLQEKKLIRGSDAITALDLYIEHLFGDYVHYWQCDNFLTIFHKKYDFNATKDYIIILTNDIIVNDIYQNINQIKLIKNSKGIEYMLCGILYGCPAWTGSGRKHEIFSQCDTYDDCKNNIHTFHDDQIIHKTNITNYQSIKDILQWGCKKDYKQVIVSSIVYEKIVQTPQKEYNINMLYEFVQNAPKTELHIHLEALVPPKILIDKKLITNLINSPNLFDIFNDYVSKMKNYIIKDGTGDKQTQTNFEFIMRQIFEYVFENRRKENITYTQFQYSGLKIYGIPDNPFNQPETGLTMLTQAKIIVKILDEFKKKEANKYIYIDFIMDIPRGQAIHFMKYKLEDYINDIVRILDDSELNKYFKGIGLGGRAEDVTFDMFINEFNKIRLPKNNGIVNPHAGEFNNKENLEQTIDFKPERIGHGVQILMFDDTSNKLIDKSKTNNISYDVCITSNIKFGVKINGNNLTYKTHPIYQMINNGLNVNLSTDDPILLGPDFNNPLTLIDEYKNFIDNCPDDWTLDNKIIETFLLIKRGWLSNGINIEHAKKNLEILNQLFKQMFPTINIKNEQKFRQKYIKYKQKYLKLKN